MEGACLKVPFRVEIFCGVWVVGGERRVLFRIVVTGRREG